MLAGREDNAKPAPDIVDGMNRDAAGMTEAGTQQDPDGRFWSGMELLPPVAIPVNHESFNIEGSQFSQILQVRIQPGETFMAEPGTMVLMSEGLSPSVDTGGCGQGCRRCCCAGENFFRLNLTNRTTQIQYLGISPNGPGCILPVDLEELSGLRFQSGAFLGALGRDWKIKIKTTSSATAGCCGGQGFFLNEIHGSGMMFLHGVGAIERIVLEAGQRYIIDKECLLAFEKTIQFDVRGYGVSMLCCCGGFGCFQTLLEGPGLVLVQSLPLSKLRRALLRGGGGGNNNNNQNQN